MEVKIKSAYKPGDTVYIVRGWIGSKVYIAERSIIKIEKFNGECFTYKLAVISKAGATPCGSTLPEKNIYPTEEEALKCGKTRMLDAYNKQNENRKQGLEIKIQWLRDQIEQLEAELKKC